MVALHRQFGCKVVFALCCLEVLCPTEFEGFESMLNATYNSSNPKMFTENWIVEEYMMVGGKSFIAFYCLEPTSPTWKFFVRLECSLTSGLPRCLLAKRLQNNRAFSKRSGGTSAVSLLSNCFELAKEAFAYVKATAIIPKCQHAVQNGNKTRPFVNAFYTQSLFLIMLHFTAHMMSMVVVWSWVLFLCKSTDTCKILIFLKKIRSTDPD